MSLPPWTAWSAQAAIIRVREHPAIDPRRVGVWGHSQGGWIVQIVASRPNDLAFAIANSGPGVTPREQDLYGVEHTLRAEGKPEDQIERAVAFTREALARTRCPFPAVFGELDSLVPAHTSAQICGQALRAAGNRDAPIVIFPQGNHRMLLPETGEFAAGYLDLLAFWAAQRVVKT